MSSVSRILPFLWSQATHASGYAYTPIQLQESDAVYGKTLRILRPGPGA